MASNIFDKLKNCLQSRVFSSDNQELILFHDEPLNNDELAIFSNYTAKEIREYLKGTMNYKSYKLS